MLSTLVEKHTTIISNIYFHYFKFHVFTLRSSGEYGCYTDFLLKMYWKYYRTWSMVIYYASNMSLSVLIVINMAAF